MQKALKKTATEIKVEEEEKLREQMREKLVWIYF
jgi:hypothetical protein